MNNYLESLLEYLKTILITVIFVVIFVIASLVIVQYQVYENQANQKPEDEEIDYQLINVLIDKNKYLGQQYPNDYTIDMKLGTLYEINKQYKDSETEFQIAISKAPYFEYKPKYKLALLYLKENKLDKAQALMDNIPEQPDKKLIKYKADIFQKLGDKYYNIGDYEDAIDKYKKALVYWDIVKAKKEINDTNNSLASAYVYLADSYVARMRPDDAVSSLEMALSLIKAPIIEYKLGLLIEGKNPQLANQYFEDVFKTAPEIINYDDYYNLLSLLADDAMSQGDEAKADLYQYRMKKIKDFYKTNVLSITDLKFVDPNGLIKNNWFGDSFVYLECRLKNISKQDFSSLFMQIVFKEGNEIVGDYTQQVVDSKSPLNAGSYTPIISINIKDKQPKKDNQPRVITAEVYVSKSANSFKLLLDTVEIKEQSEQKQLSNIVKFWHRLIRKITSKLPSFMF